MNKWTRNQKIAIIGVIISIIGIVIGGAYINTNSIKNSDFNQSPTCVGDNCQQNTNYFQDEKEIYVTPEKRLIRANMSDYSFTLKIVNERNEDYNNIGLLYSVPADYGVYRVMIKPKDETERISKYNNSLQIMLPCYGEPYEGEYWMVCFIESVNRKDEKEYEITINTRNYNNDFEINFGLIDISKYPRLINIFRGFGVE
ncbi:hypothetical protein M0R19_01055 [Candidatus Pacearchaeota archaeon]|nr:hypothetical protein [Candidatus Pacearchaeota archaeon]